MDPRVRIARGSAVPISVGSRGRCTPGQNALFLVICKTLLTSGSIRMRTDRAATFRWCDATGFGEQ
jgi:hypothetical protein